MSASVVHDICSALAAGDRDQAVHLASNDYPFLAPIRSGRRYNKVQALEIHCRDGFVDRYSGERLVFPGTLYLLNVLLPDEFPCHPHGKMSETHFAFWELFPTVDHVVPVSRGGADDASNWVTTSGRRNQAKLHWTLEELGWELYPPGDMQEWDGLLGWFRAYSSQEQDVLDLSESPMSSTVAQWNRAADKWLANKR